jgi:Mg2+-importing ATPase
VPDAFGANDAHVPRTVCGVCIVTQPLPYEKLALTSAAAEERLLADGPNEPVVRRRDSLVMQLVRRFASPLVAILLLSSVVSAVLGDELNASIIVLIVLVSVVIELVQTRRSERAAEALGAVVAQTATVFRDGAWKDVPRRTVVVGDVVRVSAGDMVPADARLLEANDLHVSEAALTGESLPVEKHAEENATISMGSSVVSGKGIAFVTAIGASTAFGEIAKQLARRPPQSDLERGMARFGMLILRTVLFLILFVFIVTALKRHDALQSLLFAVALAVGLTPEFLPMITTVTLTRGAVRMAEQRVIVKNLASIQSFGSVDVLCCDKTGTLTTGKMQLEQHVDPLGEKSDRPLLLAFVNSYFESGVENALDAAVLAKSKIDPLDAAVLQHEHPDISGYEKLDEIPFDFERRRVSVVAKRDGEILLVTKGAPEHVLAIATRMEVAGKEIVLDEAARARCTSTFAALGEKGYRVLAVGWARPETKPRYTKADEHDLVLAGFIAFVDPPREDAAKVLAALRREGIRVKILTGDSDLVAAHVCERVGVHAKHVLTGRDIDAMSDPALVQRAERAHVFARVSPAQKTRIVRALQATGHVVGFLGDGINDAPSLHAADVGISVENATDVAKEAATVILLDHDLRVLLAGVMEGRRAFGNVIKYLLMGTSSNFGNMFSMAGAAALLPFLPMLPMQILLNNFLYDLAQITIPSDNVDPELVRKPRRWDIKLVERFMIGIGPVSSLYDFLTFWVLLRWFHADAAFFHTGWFVESLATQTLVIFVIRTTASPFASKPSRSLVMTTLGAVAIALALPFSPIASRLGFVPLPAGFFLFLALATITYLGLVQIAKTILFRSRPSSDSPAKP